MIAFRLTGGIDVDRLRSAVLAAALAHGVPARADAELFGHDTAVDLDPVADRLARNDFDPGLGAPLRVLLLSANPHEHVLVFAFAVTTVDRADAIVRSVALQYGGSPDRHAPHERAATVKPALPLDRPRTGDRDRTAVTAPITLPADQLSAIARRASADHRAVALALFAVLLHRYDGGEAVSFVAPAPAGDSPEAAAAVTASFDRGTTFTEAVRRVGEAVRHRTAEPADLPALTWRTQATLAWPGVGVTPLPTAITGAATDLALRLDGDPAAGDAVGVVVLAADVAGADTAERVAGHLRRLLAGAAEDPDRPVAELPLPTAHEEAVFAAADGEDLPAAEPFPVHFQDVARRTPDAVAVRAEDGALTYAELDRAANRLAHLLRAAGVGPEVAVGLCLDRGLGLAVAVLAVLKAGGAYVPLDPRDPPHRRAAVVADSGAVVVVAERPVDLPGTAVLDLGAVRAELAAQPADRPPAGRPLPSHAAYVLYTSGSTGKPKGVVVEHRNLMAYVDGAIARFGIDRPLRYAMVQPLAVDSSVTAFFLPLRTGGEVHLISRERALDARGLAEWNTEHRVDVLKIAPSHLQALQAAPCFAELLPRELLVIGGEAADWRWMRALQATAPCRVHNHYGPTETTVGVLTLAVADYPDARWDVAAIGTPLPGVRVEVVDAAGLPVPVGVTGELVVRGATVARGYHGRPDLTEAAFGPDRDHYRTGDHVRRLADGAVAFVGRRDDQVKVRGFRVEPGEITAALREHPAVRAAVTVVREDRPGDRAVVSYAEASGPARPEELLAHLRDRVAPHMVPRAVVVLDRLPLSAHGKVDRAALPAPSADAPVAVPATGLERVVAEAWRRVLGVDEVGVEANFFDVGGHSLMLVDLRQRLLSATGREVGLLDLLAHTTVRAQARLLSAAPAADEPEVRRPRTPQQAALLRRRAGQRRARRDHDA
ncbi:non-ribosomal peptide synthetase [Saccharothrix algeriensis]|uniref:Amino acid adenylation domain-containing protein n=1 Tax=Saccharothrix algeriensis TaxID=173560 RepID=A0A8T8HYH7_9PSEU|nr:amino acid adenylation domain-containing protein [Saccharothrix algeriensis]MBM7814506.1 amino acid adenylation domain-containing protein [Saccharothrix algeriensis]QTR02804.1 amino acid adenylation domain-containing protein [Saccharothrix algeriensis]